MRSARETIEIVGAGPAGLAAAITLARAGRPVIVHEAQREVGYRFRRDLQGLENWSRDEDVLVELRSFGIVPTFATRPCRRGTAFDAWGNAYRIVSEEPLFYLVERGPGPQSLDSALLSQARSLGVEVRFHSRRETIAGPGILAIGPKAADAIAVGFHFDTPMPDGFWAICDDNLAPMGYAYVLVMGGRGTVKSCMFTGFKQEQQFVARTVEAFTRLIGLEMRNPSAHGGVGNFRLAARVISGTHAVAGEQTGLQDTLWGFGMRLAIRSGVLAARSLLDGADYEAAWRSEFAACMRAAIVNRACYNLLGNRGYRWMLGRQSRGDARAFLRRQYAPTMLRRALYPWASRSVQSRRHDESCNHIDCACVWCRCGGAAAVADETVTEGAHA